MAVLTEALSVILRSRAVRGVQAGKLRRVLEGVPDRTICSDHHRVRVGFTAHQDARAYLQQMGFLLRRKHAVTSAASTGRADTRCAGPQHNGVRARRAPRHG
jgi:hypothetical protein